jgi:hypothetical protein
MKRIIKLHKEDETRVVRKFLWGPVSFRSRDANEIEWRWLGIAYLEQRYVKNYSDNYLYWKNIGFSDKNWKVKKSVDKMLASEPNKQNIAKAFR